MCKISTVSVNKLCFFSFLCVFDDVVLRITSRLDLTIQLTYIFSFCFFRQV